MNARLNRTNNTYNANVNRSPLRVGCFLRYLVEDKKIMFEKGELINGKILRLLCHIRLFHSFNYNVSTNEFTGVLSHIHSISAIWRLAGKEIQVSYPHSKICIGPVT